MRKLLVPLASFSLLAISVAIACENVEQYVYTGQRFSEAGACLEETQRIEVVTGPGASARCIPTCFTVESDFYVSTLCGQIPAIATIVPRESPECAAAVQALNKDAQCGEEPEAPDAETDAPEPEEAGVDAEPDTAADADAGKPPVDAGSDG